MSFPRQGRVAIVTPLLIVLCVACTALNYPEPTDETRERQRMAVSDDDRMNPAAPPTSDADKKASVLAELGEPIQDKPLAWSDLTRLAREHRQRGELDLAAQRLAQAAIQVEDLPPAHARRRTVFGLRSRLAIQLAENGEIEAADALADLLFMDAEATPAVGGSAFVALAVSVADRRQAVAQENGEVESELTLLRIAFTTSLTGSISRDRMDLAVRVASLAYQENQIMLARKAIDQALSDAAHVIPTNKKKIAELHLQHARIALSSGDFDTARKSATTANRIIDKSDADESSRGIAEATLAEILAETGDAETALVIATGASARIGDPNRLTDHAHRRILAALGRVERSLGDGQSARTHLEQALAIPGQTSNEDEALVKELTSELLDWEDAAVSAEPPSATEAN